MRYDAESKKILISSREFVQTARRAIAAAVPCDAEEPKLEKTSKRLLEKIIGSSDAISLTHGFECGGYSFALTAKSEKADGCNLWFAFSIDCDPQKPKKDCLSQIRGEGYVAAYAYAKQKGLTRVNLFFTLINNATNTHATREESASIQKLEGFFKKCAATVAVYAKPEVERVTLRLPSMKNLKFPYKMARDGQREFVQTAYKNIARGGTLFATAPTGTGKTVSALYPAVHAMGDGRRDKTFYLTPKETTANAAIDCLNILSEKGAVLRAIKLSAKEKCCQNGLLCREGRDLCDYARCNRLSDAVLALYEKKQTVITSKEILEYSKEFKVCPYELSLTYAELCDVIICDFNYLFDPSVYIRRFFAEGGNYTFLIDEAHNLADRAREMYSAQTDEDFLRLPFEADILGEHSKTKKISGEVAAAFREVLYPLVKEELVTDSNGNRSGAVHLKEIPSELYGIFDLLLYTAEEEILQNYPSKDDEKNSRISFLRDFCYKIKKFHTVMQSFDSSYEMFIFYENEKLRAKLFCIDTGNEISKRLEKGSAAVFFSATLSPLYFYKSILGGDGSSDILEVDSPFDKDMLSVSIMDKISTRFSEREDTLSAVCRVIAATVSAKRGNYMIFSPSFAYSEALSRAFSAKYPKIKILTQRRDMSKKEKEEFLREFSKNDKSYLIGFCVMGGIYSEGIDLAGDSLIGAVVVGIGMPSPSYEREAICAYYDDKFEEGKQFAYIYPGMNRVLQAAGRVIRREDDKGVIVLIDDRFDDPIYKKIIPSLWSGMRFIADAKTLRENLDRFWKE
ncbi:MAG: ATP-dependent DNA helicase [Ruminococcaceae bacterium]|nr:ATP-dependent DNA helicase [Oscillospiraceae bacterium]